MLGVELDGERSRFAWDGVFKVVSIPRARYQ